MARGESSKYVNPSSYHDTHFYEKPLFQYLIIASILATLVISIVALLNIYQIKNVAVPRTISANDFLKKLTAHAEMKSYVGAAPLNIVQVTKDNLANLQSQINGLDASYIGTFIVQYSDRIIVYDYNNDKIAATVTFQQPQQGQLPQDFFTKLNKHAELQGLQSEQPIGGQLDAASLKTLQQQFPDVYKDAKVGDFLLRYKTRLIIYDYTSDRIINAVNLQ